jgi:hypothetical protein
VNGDEKQAIIEHGFCLRDALADDAEYICRKADAVAMMVGWEGSLGPRAELALALALGLEVIWLQE